MPLQASGMPIAIAIAIEAEYAKLVLADDAITGLRQALAGQFVPDEELDQALGVAPAP